MPSTIRQLDVFRNPVKAVRADKPYLVNLQNSFLDDLSTRVVAPLVTKRVLPLSEAKPWYPEFRIDDAVLYLDPTDLASFPTSLLRDPVMNLDGDRYRILRAIDLVITGV